MSFKCVDQLPEDRPVAVVGAGTLGRRIALLFTTRGGTVNLIDPQQAALDDAQKFVSEQQKTLSEHIEGAKQGSLETFQDLAAGVKDAWLVVESIPEKRELKLDMFEQLEKLAASDAILATNSSSFPSSEVIDRVKNPARVLNIHFFMPPMVNCVEVMTCGHTDEAIFALLKKVLPEFGISPFFAQRESIGFIYNRIWAAIKRETLMVVAEGVSTPEEIDKLFCTASGASFGPCRNMDRVGLDVVLNIEEHYADARGHLPESPRKLLHEMVGKGWLGMKSGRGFYNDYQ